MPKFDTDLIKYFTLGLNTSMNKIVYKSHVIGE